jgi:hypothetical protein
MIKTFADKRTQELYLTGKAKRFPPDVAGRAARNINGKVIMYADTITGSIKKRSRKVTAGVKSSWSLTRLTASPRVQLRKR